MKQSTDTCASCSYFDLAASMDSNGHGQCEAWPRPTQWNEAACILYVYSKNDPQRAVFVKQLRKREEDGQATA